MRRLFGREYAWVVFFYAVAALGWGQAVVGLMVFVGGAGGMFAVLAAFTFATGSICFVHASRLRRALARRAAGQCGGCGYDLRASAGRCPECGAAAAPGAA